jgi:RNA polymerase sigma-70 factor (ECF subfamily)
MGELSEVTQTISRQMGGHVDTLGASSDAQLIARSLATPEAFGGLFDRHFTAVHRYLARRIGREHADDLASQTFTVAFERRATFRPGGVGARPWLLGIATNLLRNDRRSEQRLLETLAILSADAEAAGIDGPAGETDCELAAALSGLDGDQRDVLLLYAWAELSYEEIADSLAIPVGTVRSRLSRARSELRSQLTVRRGAPGAGQTPMQEETR